MKNVLWIVWMEIAVSFFLGGVPTLIAYSLGGIPLLQEFAKDLLPKGLPVYYAFALSAIALAALYSLRNTSGRDGIKEFFREIQGLQSIFRIGAGFLITFCAIWWLVDPPKNKDGLLVLLAYGLISFAVSVVYSWLSRKAQPSKSSSAGLPPASSLSSSGPAAPLCNAAPSTTASGTTLAPPAPSTSGP